MTWDGHSTHTVGLLKVRYDPACQGLGGAGYMFREGWLGRI